MVDNSIKNRVETVDGSFEYLILYFELTEYNVANAVVFYFVFHTAAHEVSQ